MFSTIREIMRPVEMLGAYTIAIITGHAPGLGPLVVSVSVPCGNRTNFERDASSGLKH